MRARSQEWKVSRRKALHISRKTATAKSRWLNGCDWSEEIARTSASPNALLVVILSDWGKFKIKDNSFCGGTWPSSRKFILMRKKNIKFSCQYFGCEVAYTRSPCQGSCLTLMCRELKISMPFVAWIPFFGNPVSFRSAYSISHGTFTIAMIYTKSESVVFSWGIKSIMLWALFVESQLVLVLQMIVLIECAPIFLRIFFLSGLHIVYLMAHLLLLWYTLNPNRPFFH